MKIETTPAIIRYLLQELSGLSEILSSIRSSLDPTLQIGGIGIIYRGTLNSRQAASPLVRLVVGDEIWEAPDPFPRFSPSKLGWNRAKSYCHLFGAQGYGQRQACI
ncbi:hypothetical protein TNCV_1339591 [Trichonephila clavipes]|uniref:Uncharacterized protein n=1 Tax=Trichonephila clavipes TaxID=2585209 RepID=A0A8X6R842_TRICX|nr:hypothetical protein TNCV_1339591 [Trichonephila clavipes]